MCVGASKQTPNPIFYLAETVPPGFEMPGSAK